MDTREKILSAALILFAKNGFTVNTTTITEQAGVSTGILFHYFPTKNDLIGALYAEFIHDFYQSTNRVKAGLQKTDLSEFQAVHRESLLEAINWSLDNWKKYQYIQLFEGTVLAEQLRSEGDKKLEEMNATILDVIQLGIDRGIFKDLPPKFLLNCLYAITNSIVEYIHGNPGLRYDEEFLDQAWKIYWHTAAK